jgi:hypothetical protein
MLPKVFDAFVEASPISVMARGLAERLLDADKLDAWFESVESSQYTRELPFSTVFSLMSQVVCGTQKSVNAAYQAAKDEVPTSIVSVYSKLKGIEVETSAALVRYAAAEATALIEALEGPVPGRLPGYRVKLLDGNCIAASEHRIKALRTTSAGPLPGKSLVVLDPALHLPIDVFPCLRGRPRPGARAARRGAREQRARRCVGGRPQLLHLGVPQRNCQGAGLLRYPRAQEAALRGAARLGVQRGG